MTRREARGVTLVEVLMATLIVSTVIVSASWAMSAAVTARQLRTEAPADATRLAREVHELALTLDVGPKAPPAMGAAGLTGLGALDGARFSPALLATGEPAPGGDEWVQEVSISVHALVDLTLPEAPAYEPLEPGDGRIYRLSVHMLRADADMGTWWWWIDP